ncbi:MAG: ectonucleotide pyrophosphatase/phosphodiesterase [Rhodothermales bacterium]|nr:ectonucleotide pyrophosphatase/phosphodiesterase [Rhodothermales bacterium]
MRRSSPILATLGLLALLLGAVLVQRACQAPRLPHAETAEAGPGPTVLMISIDGFRADYLDRYEAPTLARLAREGVRAEALIPAFPTKTFPNHYTLVTGLYPSHHGIVANTMYDPVFDAGFSLGDREAVRDARWWEGEPLWVTAERQGRRTAPYFWPGSEAAIQGVRPTYWKVFDDRVPGAQRVDDVLGWLALPAEERPAFLTLYFSDVDHAGHDYGPDAPETAAAVRRVDGYLARLVDGLAARGLLDAINLIVVSDHGMAATAPDRAVFLDDYIDLDDVRVVDWSPVAALIPAPGRLEAVVEGLRAAPHLAVYPAGERPVHWHHEGHRRIPPVLAVAEPGWVITTRASFERDPQRFSGGTHGYDNHTPSMQALFVARGPAFAQGLRAGPFENVHVYNLAAAILGLEPAPNDGDLDAVRHLLRPAAVPR